MNPQRWHERYAWHMKAIPELIRLARDRAMPSIQAQRYDRDKIDGGGDIHRLPFEASGTDDADLLWALLVLYAREVVELVGGSGPSVLRLSSAVWTTQEANGFRAATSTGQAVRWASEVAGWLVKHREVIGQLSELWDAEEVLFARVRALRHAYGLEDRPKPDRRRYCELCGERGVISTWATVAGEEVCRVFCTICGATVEEGGEVADVLGRSEESPAQRRHDQALAT